MSPTAQGSTAQDQRYLTTLAVILAVAVFLITWFSIRKSRSDSFELLAEQGRAFTESLAQASQNAITSELFYDHLVRQRYSDLVVTLMDMDVDKLSDRDWASFALTHDLLGAYLYRHDSGLVAGATVRGVQMRPPAHVEAEVDSLFADPETRFVLLLEEGDTPGKSVHYYLELTSQLNQVVVFASDALFYTRALSETGIGHLAQAMARERGVEYIVYQTIDEIVFSSRRLDGLSAISEDSFLTQALDADSIVQRVHEHQGKKILEMVRPFSTSQYPGGLFRVGLSLDRYYTVSRGFDRQTIILSGVLVVLLLVALAYIRGRRKRYEMMADYEREAQRRERLSEMGNLAAGVAHEIRNPLNTISIAAQRLAREFTPTANHDQYQGFTSQIRTETSRLNDIITRFLALARDEQKQQTTIRLDLLLVEIGELLKVEGDKIGLAVTVTCESGIVLTANPDRLKEAFHNLFNNTKEALGGRPGKFMIEAARDGDRIRISVSDTGPGIPEELRERVFAPYYTSKEGGTGLGLPTVQRIISDLGGEIVIDPNYTSGTKFVIMI
ncbi:MAG: HAMP domain-containing sensor histidine kinase [Candidatus Zixiibacteriota bacterium]